MTEADLQRLVCDAASALGWHWMHCYPLRTANGWATPTSGPLGPGWPDLTLAHPRGRLLAVELKAERGVVSAEQLAVHAVLKAAGLDVHIVRPSTVDAFLEVLR
jgi:hypothetical protein